MTTDMRSLVLRSASASGADLAPFRRGSGATIAKLISDLDSIFGLHQNTATATTTTGAGGGKTAALVPQYKNEYEITCAIRFIHRCMVAEDDPTGRDADLVQPRPDLLFQPSSSSSQSGNNNNNNNNNSKMSSDLLSSFSLLASTFCRHVSQSAVGMMAVDGLHRLVSVYGDTILACLFGINSSSSSNNNSNLLEGIAAALFFDLNVQELPTMCRRNAIKVLLWFVQRRPAWDAAIVCSAKKMMEDGSQQPPVIGNNNKNSAAVQLAMDVSAHAAWLAVLAGCTNEERDPVNVLAVFDISIAAHDNLVEKMLLQSPAAHTTVTAASGTTMTLLSSSLSWPAHVGRYVLGKILLTDQQRMDLAQQEEQQDKDKTVRRKRVNAEEEDDDSNSNSSSMRLPESTIDPLADGIEGLFQVSSGYFPLQFSPSPSTKTTKEQLVQRLHTVMSRPLFGAFAVPLVMHKMQSATSNATILSCIDALRRIIEAWSDNRSDDGVSSSSSSALKLMRASRVRAVVARRFLKDLFPFLRAFIQHQAASQSGAVASGVIGVLSDASALYDSSWKDANASSNSDAHGTGVPFQQLLQCPTVNSILQTLPSPSSSDNLLDASMVHAIGRNSACPLLAMLLGATVLPLVASDRQRIATTSAVFANFEINSAPPVAATSSCCGGGGGGCCGGASTTAAQQDSSPSSSCCKQQQSQQQQQEGLTLGAYDSPRANALRSSIVFDSKSQETLHVAFEGAVSTAAQCLQRAAAPSNTEQREDEHDIRAAADIIASAVCLRARKLTQLVRPQQSDAATPSAIDAAVSALLCAWSAAVGQNTWRQHSPTVVSALSSSVGVCLCIVPGACKAALFGESSPLRQASANSSGATAAVSDDELASFVRNAAATLHGVIAAVSPHYRAPTVATTSDDAGAREQEGQQEDSLDILVQSALELRGAALRLCPSRSDAFGAVDRLCLAPIGGLMKVAASPAAALLPLVQLKFLPRLAQHIEQQQQQQQQRGEPTSAAQLAFLLEFVFELAVASSSSPFSSAIVAPLLLRRNINNSNNSSSNSSDFLFVETLKAHLRTGAENDDGGLARAAAVLLLALENGSETAAVKEAARCKILAEFATTSAGSNGAAAGDAMVFAARVACSTLRLTSIAASFSSSSSSSSSASTVSAADVLDHVQRVMANAAACDSCLAEVVRPSHLSDDAGRNSGSGGGASWRVAVAKSLLSSVLQQLKQDDNNTNTNSSSSSSAKNNRNASLHLSTVLVRSIAIDGSGRNHGAATAAAALAFRNILASTYSSVLPLIQLGDMSNLSGASSVTTKQQDGTDDNNNNNNSSKITAYDGATTMGDASYIADCLTWLDWLLKTDEEEEDANTAKGAATPKSPKSAVLEHLILSEPQGAALVHLSALACASGVLALAHRESALQILSTVGHVCLDLCLERSPKGAAFEAAARPVVGILTKRLRECLSDKKRVIRSAAAECRHVWLLLPKK